MEKLAHYEDLEEQGLLLKLPCKVGDTVYEIAGVKWVGDRDWQYQSHKEAYAKETKFTLEKYNMFGLTVFLTKEEAEKKIAEKALAEMSKDCTDCRNYWQNTDTENECNGQDKPCHEFAEMEK